jgi:hypothetical protein
MGSAAQESDLFVQVRQMGADDRTKQIGPARVSYFFAQVRHMSTLLPAPLESRIILHRFGTSMLVRRALEMTPNHRIKES